jgi:hypothetical protein
VKEFKQDILNELNHELEEARKRQLPNAKRESGCMRGLLKAMEVVENYK